MLRAALARSIPSLAFVVAACAPSAQPTMTVTPVRAPDVGAPIARDATIERPPVVAAADAVATRHTHLDGVEFGLPVHDWEQDERVVRYLTRFAGPWRDDFTAQLERGTQYESMIRRTLRDAGLPEDLHYLALVESGFDPDATSRVGAVGMWQFMAGTARDVGLRVDWWVDERRDPVRATQAAARNLRWLRSQFGSTYLAVAAYNGGETRVARGLTQLAADERSRAALDPLGALSDNGNVQGAEPPELVATAAERLTVGGDDARYFALSAGDYLRAETKNYVPQLIAALLIAKEPSRYGVALRSRATLEYDSVRVAPLTPLASVAAAAGLTRDALLALNPQLLRGVTPPGAATLVRLPLGTGERVAAALAGGDDPAFRTLTSKKRETLAGAAERAGVTVATLRRYNPQLELATSGKWKGRVIGGQRFRTPTRAVLAYARDVPDYGGALSGLPTPAAEEVRVATVKPSTTKPAATKPAATKPAAKRAATKQSRATTAKRPAHR